ncbi:unnamed protein product [Heterobilharzia americana]|nr:unnamed protein product [Heterobilharzia americana]
MAFSLPNNPYFSAPSSSMVDVAEFRQNLVSRIFGRPQDYDLSHTPSQSPELLRRSDHLNPRKPLCASNNLFNSPGWFQHALASSLQMGLLSLPRYMLKDICLPPLPPQPLNMRLSRPTNMPVPFEPVMPEGKPKVPSKLPSRTEHFRSSSFNNCDTFPMSCRQPTVRPTLKRQVERPKMNWCSNSTLNPIASVESQDTGTLVPSLIDGEVIMGFNVWGEKRLCLPHLFRFVLHDVDLQIIDKACTKLQIACTTCTPAQLSLLHSRQILPRTVGSCGLIRKSDAERLTKYIRHQSMCLDEVNCEDDTVSKSLVNVHTSDEYEVKASGSVGFFKDQRHMSPVSTDTTKSTNSLENKHLSDRLDCGHDENQPENDCKNTTGSNVIPVIHECFGRQLGLIYPDLYKEPYSKCIKCVTCCRYFSPEQFVGHTHTVTEVDNLNHWGRRLTLNSTPILANLNSASEPDSSGKTNTREPVITVDAHRRLEEFKIKFAQPIKLPPSLSAALRSVGLCASVAPFPPGTVNSQRPQTSEVSICEQISALIRKNSQSKTHQSLPVRPNKVNDQAVTSTSADSVSNQSPPCNVILPQLTLRRLWAPNDGRIKLPPPPKLLTSCEMKSLPEKFQTGPPLLLHSHRVVTQDAAHQYDRDFIPNVCLKPFNGNESKIPARWSSSRNHRHRRSQRRQTECDSVRSSRSRSCSEYSSGSRSSRTRSSSSSSASSSRCSCNKNVNKHIDVSEFRWMKDGQNKAPYNCSLNSSSPDHKACDNSAHETCNTLKPDDFSCVKKTPFGGSTFIPRVHRLRKVRSLSRTIHKCNRLRRVSSCPPTYSVRQTNGNSLQCSNDKHNKRKLLSSISAFQTNRKKSNTSQMDRGGTKQRSKALAAARAAQGAASRTGPGLWTRHFVDLQNSSGDSMKLPTARRSVSQASDIHNPCSNPMNNIPVLVTNPMKNSLPAAVLALEAIWADLVRLINEYTVAVESRSGVDAARQRLFEQFISMQTCYATHIAGLMDENQKLHEKLTQAQSQLLLFQPSCNLSSMFDCELDNKPVFNRSDETLNLVIQNNNNCNDNLSRFPRNEFPPSIIDPIRNVACVNKLKPIITADEVYSKINTANNPTVPVSVSPLYKHSPSTPNDHLTGGFHPSSSRCLSSLTSPPILSSSYLKRKSDASSNSDFESHPSLSSSSLPVVLQDRLDTTDYPEILQSSSNRESPSEGEHSQGSSTPTASETDGLTKDPVDDNDPNEEIHHSESQSPHSHLNIGREVTESNICLKRTPSIDKSTVLWDQSHQQTVRNTEDTTSNFISKLHDTQC